jgi:hypothetical protein
MPNRKHDNKKFDDANKTPNEKFTPDRFSPI